MNDLHMRETRYVKVLTTVTGISPLGQKCIQPGVYEAFFCNGRVAKIIVGQQDYFIFNRPNNQTWRQLSNLEILAMALVD